MTTRLTKTSWKSFTFLMLALSFFSSQAFSQTDEIDIEGLLEQYEEYLEQFSDLSGCGHFLDAPAYAIKQAQNIFLDAVVELDAQERKELGEKAYESVRDRYYINNSHSALPKLRGMMQRLLRQLDDNNQKFTLYIVETDDVNAFATAGGYIYFTTGILDFVDSDDELAAIMGHEIGHVVEEHVMRQYKKMALYASLSEQTDIEDLEAIAMNIDLTLNTPFDQIDEYDADKVGVNLAKKAGYNPNRFGDFFTKIANGRNSDVLSKLGSTHPFPLDRKECINEWLDN